MYRMYTCTVKTVDIMKTTCFEVSVRNLSRVFNAAVED